MSVDAMQSKAQNVAVLALGSNLGDRVAHLRHALRALQKSVGRVEETSCLYQTTAQYVEDQPSFLNAACLVRTHLPPESLLVELKHIERALGRSATFRYGPRVVDLDIVFYNDSIVDTMTAEGPLHVPHKLVHERAFVLRPLCDLNIELKHPTLHKTVKELHSSLPTTTAPAPERILPVRPGLLWPLGKKTYVVGIVNITPDSFSDGGKYSSLENVLQTVRKMEMSGCDMIDIGGESSQPGAARVSVEEEVSRVVPVIEAIRKESSIPISIDTTKSNVAAAAVRAGADVVNDISSGAADPKMLDTVAELGVILMHMRGDPQTMKSMKDYKDVIDDVSTELNARVKVAYTCGIPRWNVITDPGIGFAKGMSENLELLRRCREFTDRSIGSAVLIGPSRKQFIGTLCGKSEPNQRGWGTAATCAASIHGGADMLRVHDVEEMVDVAKVSDAIWRQ